MINSQVYCFFETQCTCLVARISVFKDYLFCAVQMCLLLLLLLFLLLFFSLLRSLLSLLTYLTSYLNTSRHATDVGRQLRVLLMKVTDVGRSQVLWLSICDGSIMHLAMRDSRC